MRSKRTSEPGSVQAPPSSAGPALPNQRSLPIGRTDDPLEHEADRVAREALREPSAGSAPTGRASPTSAPPVVHEALASPGRPLDPATRAFFEPRLGRNLGGVRVHDDSLAAGSADAVDSLAYTVGEDIAFSEGRYAPGTREGDRLLAHELVHVGQQDRAPATVRRQEVAPAAPAKPRINYAKAKRENEKYAKPDWLGWETKLATIVGGSYKSWADLWAAGKQDEFADEIAAHQALLGWKGSAVDGVLGPGTWGRIAGFGEAMAGIVSVHWEKSEELCYVATTERIKRGFKATMGEALELGEDVSAKTFDIIIATMVSRMRDVDVAYRGTGAAGALVYAGLGRFVTEDEIWAGVLRPGAAIQVWGSRDAYDLLVEGEIEEDGEKRALTEDDANFYGTSFVFVRYDAENEERMLVRHFGRSEWMERSEYDVWIAANTIEGLALFDR